MIPAQLLISFARHRKSAYKTYGALDGEREKAAAEIIRVSQFFLKTHKCGWVHQLKNDIEILMPDPDSKDSHWIEKIQQLFKN